MSGPRVPGPGLRRKRRAQQPSSDVEMDKISPEEVFKGENAPTSKRGVKASSEEDILAHAVPIDPTAIAAQKAAEQKKEEGPKQKFEAPEEVPESPLDRILSSELVTRMSEKLKLKKHTYVEVDLEVGEYSITALLRRPSYEDTLWALGEIEYRVENQQDYTLLRSAAQRTLYLNHLTSCRTVMQLDGSWVWDVFEMGDEIKDYVAESQGIRWDLSYESIPDVFKGELATGVYQLLRKMEASLLFTLQGAADEAFSDKTPIISSGDGPEGQEEDPSSAT